MERICNHHRPMVFRKNVLTVSFLQFHTEIRVSFHGDVHGMAILLRYLSLLLNKTFRLWSIPL